MKKKIFLSFCIILIFTINLSMAHKGRTDGYGGHYNHSTGYYHYHSGQYANTGDYTAPIEEGGIKVEEKSTEENYRGLIVNNNTTEDTGLKEENNQLKNELQTINSKIYNMNAISINDVENTLNEQQNKIESLENDKTNMWVTFIILLIIGYIVAYHIGKSKE